MSGLVGVKDIEIPAHHDTGAGELAENVRHHLVAGHDLVVEPDVLDGHAELFQQAENQAQFAVDERFAGDAPVEKSHAHQILPVQDRHGDLGTQQFELLLHLQVAFRIGRLAPENASVAEDVTANARGQGQVELPEQAGRQADGTRGSQPARCLEGGGIAEHAWRLAQENGGAVDAEDFAQQQEKFLQQQVRLEAVAQDRREIAQHAEQFGRGAVMVADGLGRGGWTGGSGAVLGRRSHGADPLQEQIEQPRPHRFGEHLDDPEQIGFFLPLPLLDASIDEQRGLR